MIDDDNAAVNDDVDPETLALSTTTAQIRVVLEDILRERIRQDEKWGFFRDFPDGGNRVGDDAAEKVARQECERAARLGKITWRHIIEEEMAEAWNAKTDDERVVELIQTIACMVAQVEAIRRRKSGAAIIPLKPRPWWRRWLDRLFAGRWRS